MVRSSNTILWTALVTVSLVAGVTVVAQPVAATHGGGDSGYVDPAQDYTENTWDSVWWGYGPGAHETGEESGWAFRSTPTVDDFNMEYFQYVAIHAPWADMSNCVVTDTNVAGIDRGDDNWEDSPYDPSNDEGLVQDIQNSKIIEHYGYFQFAGPEGFGDRGIPLNSSDSFTAGLECFQNPSEEGWYRLSVWFNGTGYDGNYKEYLNWNNWKYFCNNAEERCSNREQAKETLGPPPSELEYSTGEITQNYEPDTQWSHTSGPPGGSGGQNADDTPTATPGGAESTEAPGGGGQTPTEAAGGGGDGSAPTEAPGGGSQTPTEAASGDGGGASTDAPGGGAQTPTEAAGGGAADGGQSGGGSTPTAGSGPGLGPFVAITAFLIGTVLLYRRP